MLPCLEKLSLATNPMCIIPDYRTKVLAQFCDRASEVWLTDYGFIHEKFALIFLSYFQYFIIDIEMFHHTIKMTSQKNSVKI